MTRDTKTSDARKVPHAIAERKMRKFGRVKLSDADAAFKAVSRTARKWGVLIKW